ncbi:Basal-body rod modification protein FlgD [Jannaschia seosinensis]|uniref:Basal-body rod modification protein FlgD n=1 Tax=Jannaschia seosinensis TaxID=313367 RepID=A0A0M7BAG1_9RHOB|nr:flagellar hook capping FlgD N-terminal domain-containing protein [Jannaschia seosinensis]CUH34033.1 Basal-body rod modification protein FlgD [Jannaschia seosinensis]
MDALNPTFGTTSTSAASRAAADGAVVSSDFDTFLKLLTAQIRNQDPLEPADSTEYTAQLATFSNVEQAVQTNNLLERMISRLDAQQVTAASDLVGMEVRNNGPVAHLGGSTVFHPQLHPGADRAELVVTGRDGKEIARHPFNPRAGTVAWPPAGQGATVPNGAYTIVAESWSGERALEPTPVDHYAVVEEVVLGQSGTELLLSGDMRLPMEKLQSVRRPAG